MRILFIERKLEGMANQQENLLNQLEETLRKNLFGLSRETEKPKHPKVWRKENVIFVKAFSTRGMQGKITIEKSNSDLVIISKGYKHTLLGKIFLSICLGFFVFMIPLVIVLLVISGPAGQTHPPKWDKIIVSSLTAEVFACSVAWFMWTELIRRPSNDQNQGLLVEIQQTINSFKEQIGNDNL